MLKTKQLNQREITQPARATAYTGDDHGKQLMNWNISLVIYFVASVLLVLVVIGILLIPILILLHLIFSIMGAVAANRGDLYRYPIAIPFFS